MKLVVNGADVEVDDRHAKTPLLWVLRDVIGLHGTKFGCGAGFCAACTVLIDGRNTKSCQTATERAVGKTVTTVEGASGPVIDAVRDAWHRGNVVQCGYCQPGQTLAAASLLESDPSPDDAKIDSWMSGNLCRCGTYPRIRAAIHEAAGTLAAGHDPGPLVAPPDPEVHRLTPEEMADPVHPYIRIREDGTIVAYSSQIEMGQGIHTGLATIVAEELDADFDSVRVVNASNGAGRPAMCTGIPTSAARLQITGASNSTKGFWVRYRAGGGPGAGPARRGRGGRSGACPSTRSNSSAGSCVTASGREATFGQLAARAEQLPVPDGVEPKDAADYKLIGSEGRLRVDAVPKILGTTRFTIDVSVPGMLTAVVLHPPRFGATVASVDDQAALAEPGVDRRRCDRGGRRRRRRDGRRRSAWAARVGVDWDDSDAERRSSDELLAEHVRLLESGEQAVVAREDGGADEALEERTDGCRRDVRTAVSGSRHDGAEQRGVPDARRRGARGLGEHRVARVHADVSLARRPASTRSRSRFTSPSPGDRSDCTRAPSATPPPRPYTSLGRSTGSTRSRSSRCARRTSRRAATARWPCTGSGPEPTQTVELTAYHQQIVAEPTSTNLPFVRDVMFTNGVDFFTTTGAADPPVRSSRTSSSSRRTSSPASRRWCGDRSVTRTPSSPASRRSTSSRSPAGRDPVDLRRELLADNPRTLRALELAAEIADWGTPLPEGRARGITCSSFLSHSANVTEISLDARERVHVDRIVFALDCGITINPDLVRAQVEGGLAVRAERRRVGRGRARRRRRDRHPELRPLPDHADALRARSIEVHLIESTEPPTGVGEVSVPSVAPALANAIAALTGTRIRQLPITKTIKIAEEGHPMPDVNITPTEDGPYIVSGPVHADRRRRTRDRASRSDGDVPLRTLLEQAVLRRHPRHDRLRRHPRQLSPPDSEARSAVLPLLQPAHKLGP